MKTLTQTIALTSILFAASAIASAEGLAPPMHSTEFNMSSPSTMMAGKHGHPADLYENTLSKSSTERQIGQGSLSAQHIADFCVIADLSVALNEHSVENHLGGKQC
jgi:hypothetical protein